MHMLWVNTGLSRKTSLICILIGLLILFFSPFIPGIIGILLSAVLFILSLILIGIGITTKGTGFSLPILIIGLTGGALSLFALISPETTISLMGIILGVIILIAGVSQLFFSPQFIPDRLSWIFLIMGGIATIIVGLSLILFPKEGMQLFIAFLGCYLILYGIIGYFKSDTNFCFRV